MKFVSFINHHDEERLGLFINDRVIDLQIAAKTFGNDLPGNMKDFLEGGDDFMDIARVTENMLKQSGQFNNSKVSRMLAPVPHPASCRDAYAFRQHVAAARKNRGVDMIPEFDHFPIFYFTNHNAVFGEGEVIVEKDHLLKLDFELEWAAVIGKKGKNVDAKDADSYIAGFTIMNDLSARQLQMEEMKLNLGPAKGKDFATTIGPWMVTPDELRDRTTETERGNIYGLKMEAFHNGEQISEGNTKDMTFTFAEIIERVSYGVEINPGDVIGSGTVGTGCYLEINGTNARLAKEKGEDFTPRWLQPGDEIELRVEMLGSLKNKIVLNEGDYSILAKKKV